MIQIVIFNHIHNKQADCSSHLLFMFASFFSIPSFFKISNQFMNSLIPVHLLIRQREQSSHILEERIRHMLIDVLQWKLNFLFCSNNLLDYFLRFRFDLLSTELHWIFEFLDFLQAHISILEEMRIHTYFSSYCLCIYFPIRNPLTATFSFR